MAITKRYFGNLYYRVSKINTQEIKKIGCKIKKNFKTKVFK